MRTAKAKHDRTMRIVFESLMIERLFSFRTRFRARRLFRFFGALVQTLQQRNILRRSGQQKFLPVVFHDRDKPLLPERERLAKAQPALAAPRVAIEKNRLKNATTFEPSVLSGLLAFRLHSARTWFPLSPGLHEFSEVR